MSHSSYNVIAVLIFLFVTINFIFPCNRIIPLDRRTTSILGAVMCYISRTGIDVLHAVSFDVMILLAAIMIINHIVIHLKETKQLILCIQKQVHDNPINGLWIVSLAAYLVSPFLTNDGVCLLFVEPILNVFEEAPLSLTPLKLDLNHKNLRQQHVRLRKADAMYFLLALACSANIGSALTYTGNPQNMIVASDAIQVMPSYKFLLYMLPASMFSWLITMKWIQRCWLKSRAHIDIPSILTVCDGAEEGAVQTPLHPRTVLSELELSPLAPMGMLSTEKLGSEKRLLVSNTSTGDGKNKLMEVFNELLNHVRSQGSGMELVLSPRRIRALERAKSQPAELFLVQSPFPYAIPSVLFAMMATIFAGVLPIAGTVCLFAMLMLLVVVIGNHLRAQQVWVSETPDSLCHHQHSINRSDALYLVDLEDSSGPEGGLQSVCPGPASGSSSGTLPEKELDLGPFTREDEVDSLNRFYEALYRSIDYNLLLIFLGLFVVIDNLSFTGIPRSIWSRIVGSSPFRSFASVVGISLFVLISSQFLGNVAVIQLAKPNVEDLSDDTKRLAWAVLSFVATVGGNLTITGSAANIIVAEKAARLDATMAIDFFRHYRVCFWVTLLSCAVGAGLIIAVVAIDNATCGSRW